MKRASFQTLTPFRISYLSLPSTVRWTCSLLSPMQVSKFWASSPCLIWEGIQPFSLHLPSAPCWNLSKEDNCSGLIRCFKSFHLMSFYWRNINSNTIKFKIIVYSGSLGLFRDCFCPHATWSFKTHFPLSLSSYTWYHHVRPWVLTSSEMLLY